MHTSTRPETVVYMRITQKQTNKKRRDIFDMFGVKKKEEIKMQRKEVKHSINFNHTVPLIQITGRK